MPLYTVVIGNYSRTSLIFGISNSDVVHDIHKDNAFVCILNYSRDKFETKS